MDPLWVEDFENLADGIPRVQPLNANPPLGGNRNNAPIIPEHGVNPLMALRTMIDYCRPNLDGASTSIARPRVAANNFEIKPKVI